MKAFVPQESTYQRELKARETQARLNAIKLCIVTFVASLNDVGLSETTIDKILKKNKSYVDSILKGNVTWLEIAETLHEEKGIEFDWIEEMVKR